MIVAGQRLPILIATRPVDFRCGHQALALMVQTELKLRTDTVESALARRNIAITAIILARLRSRSAGNLVDEFETTAFDKA
ncbi:hypothetical protein GOD68_30140 [Sinorhizobium medicae]|nr:hypothetical protein [Sinorhizobium medicae]MDX0673401.1 hypothetical protein [Sinorhizobium medicae]MDX0710608.1 hypothetical protein [Sinorhizobium medicae]